MLKRFCNIQLIIHSHNIESERFKTTGKWWWKILWHYEKYGHSKADFTFCITENDRQYFINNYKIKEEKTSVITYGISWKAAPEKEDRAVAKNDLLQKYGLPSQSIIYLFNGAFDYKPNVDAVKNIIEDINPLFIKKNIAYKIVICGKNLPAKLNDLKQYAQANIIYAGFVDDISLYFKGADVFINSVTDGGGIKTKLVEALGYNLTAVSTTNGAIGVDENICNGKLLISENNDWQSFANNMEAAISITQPVGDEFYKNFYWDNIAIKAAALIQN